MKLAPNLFLRLAATLLAMVTISSAAALADNPGQDGGTFGSAQGPSLVRCEQRMYERCRELPKLVGDKSFPDGKINYGEHGETQKKVAFPTIPGKIWPIVTQPYTPQGPEKMSAWCKVMDEITGYSQNPAIGEVNLSPAFCALALANQAQMLADTMQNPQENLARVREEQNTQTQQAADNCAAMERQQAGCAIDFVASYLNNFTVDNGNKWNQVRNQLFLPMALLLLLPGAVLAQVKSIASQGFPVLGEISPWDGIFRSIVAIFLIPATYLVVNYGIDLANSITFSIADQYQKIFGTDMYEDAMCAHIRAFPFREPSENKNYVPDQEAKMTKLSPNDTPFANLEGKMVDVKLVDPCAGLNIVPPDRANEQVKYSVNAQRNSYNQANAALAMTWNILCAFQMAYLYYLWFVGPVVAALWVYPMKQLRDAFPSWCEGVLTLCFWSLFWNTVVLLMACFRGVDDTGTIIMTALNFLTTACVKFAFDFAGLVKDAGREAGKMAQKAAEGAGKGGGAHQGNGAHSGNGHNPAPAPNSPAPGHGGTGGTGGMGAPGGDGSLASGGLNASGMGAGGEGLGGAMGAGSNSSPVSGAVDMAGFPAPPHSSSHFGAGLGTGLGIGLGAGALLAGAIELAHHHAHHNPFGGHPSGSGVAGAGNGAGGEGLTGGAGATGASGGVVDAGGVDGPGTSFDLSHDGDVFDIDHDIDHNIDFGANSIVAANGDMSGVGSGSSSLPPLSTGGVPVSLTPGDVSNAPSGNGMPPLTGASIDLPGAPGAAGAGLAGAAGAAGHGEGGHAPGLHAVAHGGGHGHGGHGHGEAHAAGHGHGHGVAHAEHHGGHGAHHVGHAGGGHGHGIHGEHHVAHGQPPHADGHGHGGHGHAGQHLVANGGGIGGVGGNGTQGAPGQDVAQQIQNTQAAQQIASTAQAQAEAMQNMYRDAAAMYNTNYGATGAAGVAGVNASYDGTLTSNAYNNSNYVDYSVTGSMAPTSGTGGVDYTSAPSGYSTASSSGGNNFTADPGYMTASSSSSGYDASAATFGELARSVAGNDSSGGSYTDYSSTDNSSINNVSANSDYSTLSTYGSSSSSYDSSYSSSYDSSSSATSYDSSYNSYDYSGSSSSTSYDNSSSSATDYSTYSSTDTVGGTPIINSQLPGANSDYSSAPTPPPSNTYSSSDVSLSNASPSQYGAPNSDISAQVTTSQQQDVSAQTSALQAAGYNAPAPDSNAAPNMSFNGNQQPQQQDTWSQPVNNTAPPNGMERSVSMNVDQSNVSSYSSYHNAGQAQVEARINPDAPVTNIPGTPNNNVNNNTAQQIAGVAGAAAMFASGLNHNKMAADARKQASMGQPIKQVRPAGPAPGTGSRPNAPGAPSGGKQSRMGAALGRANTGSQPKPGSRPNGNQAPKPSASNTTQARKSVENPMSIDAGSTLRRYRQARKMTQEELAELEKQARDSGQDWMPC